MNYPYNNYETNDDFPKKDLASGLGDRYAEEENTAVTPKRSVLKPVSVINC